MKPRSNDSQGSDISVFGIRLSYQ